MASSERTESSRKKRRGSQGKGKPLGIVGMRIFFSIFLLVGLAAGYAMFLRPWWQAQAAQKWSPVPCEILESSVESHGGKSTTYSIAIKYRYEVGGQEHFGNRYNFATGSSNSREWRSVVVNSLPPGTKTTCYVNPAVAGESVISPTMGGDKWLALIPVLFTAVGLAGVTNAHRMSGKPNTPSGIPQPVVERFGEIVATGPGELKPSSTPVKSFMGILIFSLVWNGFIFGIMYGVGMKKLGMGMIIIGLFGLIGIGMLLGAIHQFLAIFNPSPVLSIDSSAMLGETLIISWRFTGNVRRLTQLKLTLQACEKATYRRGTDTVTDTSCFLDQTLLETKDSATMSSGETRVEIPANLMHTFEASSNKIIWLMKLHGTILKWPDISLEYPITVVPGKPSTFISPTTDTDV